MKILGAVSPTLAAELSAACHARVQALIDNDRDAEDAADNRILMVAAAAVHHLAQYESGKAAIGLAVNDPPRPKQMEDDDTERLHHVMARGLLTPGSLDPRGPLIARDYTFDEIRRLIDADRGP